MRKNGLIADKRGISELLKNLMVFIVLGILALVLVLAFILPSGRTGSNIFSSASSCTDPLVGDEGMCDCFPEFGGTCPADSEGRINYNCPKNACTDDNYITVWQQATKGFDDEKSRIEREMGTKLKDDQLRMIETKYFGQCCRGAKRDTSADSKSMAQTIKKST